MAFGYPQLNPYQQYPAVQPGQARAVEVIPAPFISLQNANLVIDRVA